MTIERKRVNSDISITWQRSTGSYNYECINDTAPSMTDYTYTPDDDYRDEFGLTDFAEGNYDSDDTINTVKVYFYITTVNITSAESAYIDVTLSDGTTDKTVRSGVVGSTTAANRYVEFTTNLIGGTWTYANLDALSELHIETIYNGKLNGDEAWQIGTYELQIDYTAVTPPSARRRFTISYCYK